MAAFLPQCREESLAPCFRTLDHDHPVLPEPPFFFATGGIEVVVEFPELAENLRFAVSVIAELGALDLQEIAEGLAGVCRICDVKESVRVDRVLEIFLPPQIPEALCGAEAVERDMERRDLQLVVERPDRMFVEGLRRRSGISVPQGVSDALRGKVIDIRDTAPLVADIKVGCPVEEPVPMQDRQGASDRTRVTLRDGAIPQELGRVVGPEAEKLREEFEDPLFGRVAAGKPCAALREAFGSGVMPSLSGSGDVAQGSTACRIVRFQRGAARCRLTQINGTHAAVSALFCEIQQRTRLRTVPSELTPAF